MNNQKKQIRIWNLKRDRLPNLWEEISEGEFTELIERSSQKEIALLFGHMKPAAISHVINFLTDNALSHIIETVHSNTINKILNSSNPRTIKKTIEKIDNSHLIVLLEKCNQTQQERVTQEVPEDRRSQVKTSKEKNNTPNIGLEYYSSLSFDNSLKSSIIERIKDLEEREVILEKNYKAKENNIKEKLLSSEKQLVAIEDKISERERYYVERENSFLNKEIELKNKINDLEIEQKNLQQERLELKFPEYVDTAVGVLIDKVKNFEKSALKWNIQGGFALFMAIASAIAAFVYGGIQFESESKDNIDWAFFTFLLMKGLIIVTLFCAWAKHAFNIANAYVHESLKRSDRMHAINFGKFYLEVYGNKVGQSEMKDIFENWNINADSAFIKIKESDFSPRNIEQITNLVESLRKIKTSDSR